MQFDRLRLVGFKSFVEATELTIGPGLTGIVGPNGCGKSNLVEALRWVMGEGSARRLRAGEMDDLIFAGAAGRPARNIAEVALTIDNSARRAPFAFNERDEIEIVRRIDRGGGSAFRVNGREVRARDVQLLFADAATGAHSAALVSQGRVAALIEAKPSERRLLIEEAAGITGLQARRHESELKLNAAEDNLARLDDVLITLEAQLELLKKQARQAQRYRRLCEEIRRREARLLYARWLAGIAESERQEAELRAAERAVGESTERSLAAARGREEADTALPPLRHAEAAAGAALERLRRTRDRLEEELKRVLAARGDAERRLAEISGDLAREEVQLADAAAAVARLAEERTVIAEAETEDAPILEAARARLIDESAALALAEAVLQRETEEAAAAEARRAALERRRRETGERRARLISRQAETQRQRASLGAALPPPGAQDAAAAELAASLQRADQSRRQLEDAERLLIEREATERTLADSARESERVLARMTAEAEALAALINVAPKRAQGGEGSPVLAEISVAEGFEAALAAVFEDDLSAPLLSSGAPEPKANPGRFWIDYAPEHGMPPLPEGARALREMVTAPPALARRLGAAGFVTNEEEGWRLQPLLAPGQRLIDRAGRLWRWDGFVRTSQRQSAAAEHLKHKNRRAALAHRIGAAEGEARAAAEQAAAARAAREETAEEVRQARARLREAETALTAAREAEAQLSRRALAAESRLAALADAVEKLAADLAEAENDIAECESEWAALPDPSAGRAGLEQHRTDAAAIRRREAELRASIERLGRETERRRERLAAVAVEERSWEKRHADATAQRAALIERRGALAEEIARLAARPQAIAAESEALGGHFASAEAACREAGDALARGEAELRRRTVEARSAEEALGEARERRIRLTVLCEGAVEERRGLEREIRERLGAAADELANLAGLAPGERPKDAEETSARLDRLLREREGIGPVNLVAEQEAQESEERIAGLKTERADLTEAIQRLRRGIGALDEEGRKRLRTAFERVNEHFATLFTKLFGGGRAYLQLIENGDPLLAGVEIMASPPGKRLQMLSLMSGGEQALTALSLLFAVFLTNPAPVCVLDEVDAPLDDANVERLCSLVCEIADAAGTRFILVTHHRITMARVDRLFGVTMAERGVSQLVSVDLAGAARLRQTA